jgi:hypothetical protein
MHRGGRLRAWFARHALALWFIAIAAIGMMEFHRAAFARGVFAPVLIAWLWLGGSLLLLAIAVAMLLRAHRIRG